MVEESKQLFVWTFNQHYRQNPEQQIVLLFDFAEAGISNMVRGNRSELLKCNAIVGLL